MSDISDAIEAATANPKEFENGQTRVLSHSITDLIKADQYIQSQAAAASVDPANNRGLRFSYFIPPGAD